MLPLEARGSELEHPFAFGVVRQLLEPVVRGPGRAVLFAGGAGPAGRLFNSDRQPRAPMSALRLCTACTGWW